jgi:nicotinamide mononucleotide adenylyltransferase
MRKIYSLFPGRWSCIPPHKGHQELIKKILNEGKNVCVAIRNTPKSASDPYSVFRRRVAWIRIFWKEWLRGQFKVIKIPDIDEIVYGRKVGWSIREVHLDKDIEAISATKIRENK